MVGKRFYKLVVIKYIGMSRWLCRCDCGKTTRAVGWLLRKRGRVSCGCTHSARTGDRFRKHGLHNTPEYLVWCAAKARCLNPQNKDYKHYGGRGITMCPSWLKSFSAFIKHIGRRPSNKHTLDRIDVNGHYEPGNVRWITRREQMQNTRVTIHLTIGGITKSVPDWAESAGIPARLLTERLRNNCPPQHLLLKSYAYPRKKRR